MAEMVKRKIVQIDEEKCDGCGLCVPSCAEGALKIIDGKARLVSEVYCDGLGACLGECPRGAISIEERLAEIFDEAAVEEHLSGLDKPQPPPEPAPCSFVSGCPGAQARNIKRPETKPHENIPVPPAESALDTWPVQIMLVPPTAPFLKHADILVCADCVPFALPDFHNRFLKGKVVLIGCPKLDNNQYYHEKLAIIFREAEPNSVTVLRMEVPCCGGIVHAVSEAIRAADPGIPLDIKIIGIRGEVHDNEGIGNIKNTAIHAGR